MIDPCIRGSGTLERRHRRRLRAALLVLEDRTLLAQIVVNNATDTPVANQIDLREAIDMANTNGGDETITFDQSAFATPLTIMLTGGELDLGDTTGTVSIEGPPAGVTIDAGGASRVFFVLTSASFTGLTITGGTANNGGGGLENQGTATLDTCTIKGNSGNGLHNSGTLTLTNCTISGNSNDGGSGGGLYNVDNATAMITGCTFTGNSASLGGALNNTRGSTATLANCTIAGNSASFDGGGLYNNIRDNSTLTLTGCTVSGNTALGGAGGLDAKTATLTDTIVAGNTSDGNASDISGADASGVTGSNNLIGTGGSGGITNGANGNIVLTDLTNLGLEALGRYGGPTQTMALDPGSAAIAAGATDPSLTTDQRGLIRGNTVDIGAVQTSLVVETTAATVDTTAANLSLPGAVSLANQFGGTAISFDPTAFANAQTITLAGSQLQLTNTVLSTSITGPAAGLSVSGNHASRVFEIDGTASISDLTITEGSVAGIVTGGSGGGGMFNKGTLTLTNCTVSNNSASTMQSGINTLGGFGGGLLTLNTGTTTLTNCTVSGNSAGVAGGGLYFNGSPTSPTSTLTNCTVSGNSAVESGGGLDCNGGSLSMTNCSLSANTASAGGGLGLFDRTATLTNCTVSGNSATSGNGGGLYSALNSITTLTDCTFSGNTATGSGGGIATYGGGAGVSFSLSNCTISDNSAGQFGGGMSSLGQVNAHISNCTISGNFASQSGGGMNIDLQGRQSVPSMVRNSIVAGNAATTSAPDALGAFTSQGNNLIGKTDASSGWVASDLTGTIATPLSPLLAALGNYGGPTQTVALLPGSPAIAAGAADGAIATDGRGVTRPATNPDIGAFQSLGFTLAPIAGSTPQSASPGTAFAIALAVTVAANNAVEPVAGGVVTFTAPSTGASAVLPATTAAVGSDSIASVTASANGTGGAYAVTAAATGAPPATFQLTNTLIGLLFSGLSNPAIPYGSKATLSGTLSNGNQAPQGANENVTVTVGGISQQAQIGPGGAFSVTLNTASLGVSGSPYVVSYSYAGNALFASAQTTGNLTVNPAPLTITAANASKVFGGALPAFSETYSGFVNGETAASLNTQPTLSTTATASSPVKAGGYPITAAGAVDPNYTFIYLPGTLTINAAPLTITAANASKVFGLPIPALIATYSGFVNGESAANLTTQPALSTTATASSPVKAGGYPITASGAVDPNYTFTYVAGTLTITQAAPTIALTASASSAVFGQPVTFTATLSPAATSGTVTFSTASTTLGSVTLNGANVATLTTTALAVGSPAVTVSYSGNTNFVAATSASTSVSVAKAATQVVLVPQGMLKKHKVTSLNLKVKIQPVVPGGGVPTGMVTFELALKKKKKTAQQVLGTVALTGGTAALPVSPKSVLKKPLTIVYAGDADFQASTQTTALTQGSITPMARRVNVF
jgi:predicted outer membrane repeat protein